MLDIRFRRCPGSHCVILGNFEFPVEFACKCGCGKCDIDFEVWLCCELIRQHLNVPVVIRSACRCEAHNQAVGGEPVSDHLFGWAADLSVQGVQSDMVAELAETLPDVARIGIYEPGGLNGPDGFVHVGVRDRGHGSWKRWRFDPRRNLIEAS
ncbi:MAG: hypothetical protein JW759_08955 [Candidatus Coatesbacteria bacterium]|nr:hypothetical protein [Candidatus Coatesbacteria bacterium]